MFPFIPSPKTSSRFDFGSLQATPNETAAGGLAFEARCFGEGSADPNGHKNTASHAAHLDLEVHG